MSFTSPQSPADAPALLHVRAVAEMLGCSARTVYRLTDAGRMPSPVKLGRLIRWRRDALETWIGEGCPNCRKLKGGRR